MNQKNNLFSSKENSKKINDFINSPRVILIDQEGFNHGEKATKDAKGMAEESGLDLVEVKPGNRFKGEWPICRIMDYGKMRYNQSKKKQNIKTPSLKEIIFHYSTHEHDLIIKRNKIEKLLSKGHQVKFGIVLRGRERWYRKEARQILEKQIDELKQVAKVERIIESDKSFYATLSPVC